MLSVPPNRKLIRIALYTSPLIGILAISPIFIVSFFPVAAFLISIIPASILVLLIWGLNISVLNISVKKAASLSNYNRYIISYLICIGITMLIGLISIHVIPNVQQWNQNAVREHIHACLWFAVSLNTIVLILLDLLILKEKKTQAEIEIANLKVKNAEALNQHLKQQIHPHFLFNSLSTLKTLVKKQPQLAEEYLIKLSEFLRFSISTEQMNTIGVGDELKLCLDFLEMQKIRFGEALQYDIAISAETLQNGYLPVFSLQLLAENAIKHNALTNLAPLHISIKEEEGTLIITNKIQKKTINEASIGMGLVNLAERYRTLSGDEIVVSDTDNVFSVAIRILNK